MRFEYCECGCKGYLARAGNEYYWIYWELNKKVRKPFHLYKGHGYMSPKIGSYPSMADAKLEAVNRAKNTLNEMMQALA